MLLNLTNHNSSQWPEEQKQQAIDRFGTIHDITFPAIDPLADDNQIQILAGKFANQCLELLENPNVTDQENAVHIMGELTLCFSLVTILQSKGICCVASTTQRVASENQNGEKTSVFSFVRFRNYPLIAS